MAKTATTVIQIRTIFPAVRNSRYASNPTVAKKARTLAMIAMESSKEWKSMRRLYGYAAGEWKFVWTIVPTNLNLASDSGNNCYASH